MKDMASTADPAALKSPLLLGLSGIKQLLQCYNVGTEEIKQTLLNECDVIIECKVCRSLYRGVANFLAHKRQYCKSNYARSGLDFGFQNHMEGNREKPQRMHEKVISAVAPLEDEVKEEEKIDNFDTEEDTENAAPVESDDPDWEPPVTRKRKTMSEKDDHHPKYRKNMPTANEQDMDQHSPDGLNGVFSESSSGGMNCFRLLFTKGDGNTHKCKMCHAVCQSSESLKQHIKKHLDARSFYECGHCHRLYSDYEVYKSHLRDTHSLSATEIEGVITQPRVKKFVINGSRVYDIPGSAVNTGSSVKKKEEDNTFQSKQSADVVEIEDEGPSQTTNGKTKIKSTSPTPYNTLRKIVAKSVEKVHAARNEVDSEENKSKPIEIDLT